MVKKIVCVSDLKSLSGMSSAGRETEYDKIQSPGFPGSHVSSNNLIIQWNACYRNYSEYCHLSAWKGESRLDACTNGRMRSFLNTKLDEGSHMGQLGS